MADEFDLPPDMFRAGPVAGEAAITRNFGRGPKTWRNAKYAKLDGRAIFEGDICLITPEDLAAGVGVARGIGVVGTPLWADGLVPYEVGTADPDLVHAAIDHWQAHTPIRFRAWTDEADYVAFEDYGAAWSHVGRIGGMQEISLGGGCTVGSAVHEIGHALGLWHEQSRSDRDEHIEVRLENVAEENRHNFDKHVADGRDLGDYDFGSIMHYPTLAFSTNGQPTIVPKNGEAIGQRQGLSQGDIAAIRELYPQLAWAAAPAAP